MIENKQNYKSVNKAEGVPEGKMKEELSYDFSAFSLKNDNPIENDIVGGILSRPRNMAYVEAISKGDSMTEEDYEIIDRIQEEIEDEQIHAVENEEEIDHLLNTISKCYITGCEVHTLYGDCIHYGKNVISSDFIFPISQMDNETKEGYEFFCKYPNCLCIEIFERRISVVDSDGSVKVFERKRNNG